MALEIAKGMAHITSYHFVHRDLASRNILLGAGKSITGRVYKISKKDKKMDSNHK